METAAQPQTKTRQQIKTDAYISHHYAIYYNIWKGIINENLNITYNPNRQAHEYRYLNYILYKVFCFPLY